MLNKIFDYKLLETSVTIMFLIVAMTATVLTVYFFILQKRSAKNKLLLKANQDPHVGRFFKRVCLPDLENKSFTPQIVSSNLIKND